MIVEINSACRASTPLMPKFHWSLACLVVSVGSIGTSIISLQSCLASSVNGGVQDVIRINPDVVTCSTMLTVVATLIDNQIKRHPYSLSTSRTEGSCFGKTNCPCDIDYWQWAIDEGHWIGSGVYCSGT